MKKKMIEKFNKYYNYVKKELFK